MMRSEIDSLLLVLFLAVLLPAPAAAQSLPGADSVLLFEDFTSLREWRPYSFTGIKRHTCYTLGSEAGVSFLRASSNASASALVCRRTFNVYEYPLLSWRWKVDNLYTKGDARLKSGDDYPLRVYVIFYQEKQGLFQRALSRLPGLASGESPPHSCLNYIWSSKQQDEDIMTNSFSEKSKMIIVENGPGRVGSWQQEQAHIVNDYRRAFGKNPPATASLAIMNDSDNTGEQSVSYLDYIRISAPANAGAKR